MLVRLLALLLSANLFAHSATNPFGASIPASYRKTYADQLLLPDPQKRAIGTVRFRAEGKDATSEFAAALTRAETTATTNLRRLLQLVKATDPAIDTLKKDFAAYQTAANTARTLVQTDHHKDKQKHAEMDRAFADVEKAHKRVARSLKAGPNSPIAQVLDALQWLAEIRRDQDFCADKISDIASLPMNAVLEIEGAPEPIKALVRDLEPFIARREFHRLVSVAHSQMKSAKPEQVQYAEILNERRVVLGLRPYFLAEKLSAAAAQHSEEMVKLKYFSHDSPVPENKSFVDRIKNAAFEGAAGGECIYAGGSTASAAHSGWWYSDGHRLILYANGQTAQGIAKYASTWTFLTGSYTQFPL